MPGVKKLSRFLDAHVLKRTHAGDTAAAKPDPDRDVAAPIPKPAGPCCSTSTAASSAASSAHMLGANNLGKLDHRLLAQATATAGGKNKFASDLSNRGPRSIPSPPLERIAEDTSLRSRNNVEAAGHPARGGKSGGVPAMQAGAKPQAGPRKGAKSGDNKSGPQAPKGPPQPPHEGSRPREPSGKLSEAPPGGADAPPAAPPTEARGGGDGRSKRRLRKINLLVGRWKRAAGESFWEKDKGGEEEGGAASANLKGPPEPSSGTAAAQTSPLAPHEDSARTNLTVASAREEELWDTVSALAKGAPASTNADLAGKLSAVLEEREEQSRKLERERDELARKLGEMNARLGEATLRMEAQKREGIASDQTADDGSAERRQSKPPDREGGKHKSRSPAPPGHKERKQRKKERRDSKKKPSKKKAEKAGDANKAPTVKVEVAPKGMNRRGSDFSTTHAQRFDNIYAAPQEMVSNYVAPIHKKSDDDADFLLDALADNFVFNTLDESELNTLVDAFEAYEAKRGKTIVEQGQTGEHFYILRSGKVAYIVNGKEVGHAVPGNSFGELALLYNAPHGATYKAVDDGATLWRVDQVTFRKLLAAHTIQNDNQTKDILRRVPFLSDLDDEFLHRIADALTKVYYDKGDRIFERGSEGSVLYVIRDGEVKYKRRNRAIKVLGPGDYFGEQAIVKNEPRKADATATRDTIALALSRQVFEKVLGPLSDVITRSKDRSILRTVSLFANSDIENFEIELMGALVDEARYPAERHILVEGDYVDAPALYLVRSGVLEAYTEGGGSRILKRGSFFGVDTLMPDKDQKYGGKGGMKHSRETVEVLEDCVLGKLSLANIDSVILDLGRLGNNKPVGERDLLDRSVDILRLQRHTLLGTGSFGQVWLASDTATGKSYALKVQIKRELIDQEQTKSVCREREVMSKIDHPFIIKLINTGQDHQSVFMLLNLVQGGELFNVMHNDERDAITEDEARFYSAGILEGLAYMHRRRILYRDLKPENILIDDKGYPVLVDLGFAKVVNDKTYTLCGTPLYLAPEVILSRGHDKGADYWSLGCLMFEMILGQTPFFGQNIDQITLFNRIVNGRYYFHSNHISDEAQDLISKMLVKKSTQRLGCLAQAERDIKNHPFMDTVNFGKLSKRMLGAPWVPRLRDPLDASCFESWDHLDDKETTGAYKQLSKKEQDIFQAF